MYRLDSVQSHFQGFLRRNIVRARCIALLAPPITVDNKTTNSFFMLTLTRHFTSRRA